MRIRLLIVTIVLVGVVIPGWFVARSVTLPHTFQNGQVADAAQVNENFAALNAAIGSGTGGSRKALKPRVVLGRTANDNPCGARCTDDRNCPEGQDCSGGTCVVRCNASDSSECEPFSPFGLCVEITPDYSACLCSTPVIDYSGSGYLLSIRADGECRFLNGPQVVVVIDDDEPQVINLDVFRRTYSGDGGIGSCMEWDMPLGTGLRFNERLRVLVGDLGNGAPTITYAVE